MFLVRLVRWKQPLRHVRAYNRTNSFFSLCTYTVKQVFSFFSFFSFFPSPSSRVLIVRGFLPRHCYLLSTSTSHGTIGPNISFFVPPWNWIGRLCVFGIYRLFPFLISSRTNLLRPQMEIIIANNFCQRKCTNNCITMLFPRLKNIYQCDIFFEKKKYIRIRKYIFLVDSTCVDFFSFFENELRRVFIRDDICIRSKYTANFASIQKIERTCTHLFANKSVASLKIFIIGRGIGKLRI